MFEIGSRLKWTTGAFSLLALLVLAYSGVKFSLLYDTPLIGASLESKLAKRKWNQLETLITEKSKKDWSRFIDMLKRDLPDIKQHEEKTISSQEIQQVARYKKQVLPEISGIILTSDSFANSDAYVIIKGSIYTENDEVSGYMIKEITEKGVSLVKNDRQYFVNAPEASYSIDQGN